MNNTRSYWKLANYSSPNVPDGTYDLCLDSYWIEVDDISTGRETIKVSPSSKPIYSLGYAKYCLEQYKAMYGFEYGWAKLWIEPCFQVVRRNVPYYVAGRDFDPNATMCQDDYEYYTRSGRYANKPF